MVNISAIHHKFSHHRIGLRCAVLMLLAMLIQHVAMADGSRIVKWKDEKGVTHYGDKIPTQYSNTENSEINKQGITIKRNKPVSAEEQAVNLVKIEQDKKDRALLAAFSHENEIDLARDRNLQLDQLTLEGLQLQKTNYLKRHAEMQKYAQKYKINKQAIPEDLSADMQKNQDEIVKLNEQIADRKAMMAATRKRFNDDKARYMLLKGHAASGALQP